MTKDLINGKSTLVQVMAWCHQATDHYLSQCWSRSLSTYGVTRTQWVLCELLVNKWVLRMSSVTHKLLVKLCFSTTNDPFVDICCLDINCKTAKVMFIFYINPSETPQCARQISHNASPCNSNMYTCAPVCLKRVYYGIWDWCIVIFLHFNRLVCLFFNLFQRK